jgi:phage shock protein C
MTDPRPFVRSRHDRLIAGVIGGIAQRFGWSSNLLRVLFVIASIASAAFPGVIVYLLLWLLMPEESR